MPDSSFSDPSQLTDAETLLPINPEVGTDVYADQTVKIVLTFEGGGAKGIVHLGAYHEIEQSNRDDRPVGYAHWPRYEIRALSGTSMGALIATLVAAGYTSDEILSFPSDAEAEVKADTPVTSLVLQNAQVRNVMHLFGPVRVQFYLFRWFFKRPLSVIGAFAFLWFISMIGLNYSLVELYPHLSQWWAETWIHGLIPPVFEPTISATVDWLGSRSQTPLLFTLFMSLISGAFLFWVVRALVRGLYSTDRLIRAIDRALAAKLLHRFQELEQEPGNSQHTEYQRLSEVCKEALNLAWRAKSYNPVITFKMMRDAKCRPLAVVATNVRRSAIELFSSDTTPHYPVAVAVAASAAVPFLFRPVRLETADDEHFLFDGGVTSNLPA